MNRRGVSRFCLGSPAFTFVELMLVVVLISVFAVLNVPRMRSTFNGLKVYNFARKTSALMRYAQSKAIAEGEKIYLIYEPFKQDKARNLFLAKDDLSSPPQKNEKLVVDERFRLFIPSQIEIKLEYSDGPPAGNKEEIAVFNPDGSIEGPRIIIYNDARRFKINSKGAIGRVEVEELLE